MSHGDHLLVAGGSDGIWLDVVEVYSDNNWSSAQPLLKPYVDMRSTVLDDHWYLMGGSMYHKKEVCYASLDSLIASCQPSATSEPSSLWKELPDVHNIRSTPSVFGNRLTAIGGVSSSKSYPTISTLIHAFSPHIWSWVHVGDLPVAGCRVCTVVLPSGELIVIGGFLNNSKKVYKATLKG